MAEKIKKSTWLLFVSLAIFVFIACKIFFYFTARPTIKINYAAELNKLTKPENYDPDLNAYFDYEKAEEFYVEEPEGIYSYPYYLPSWPGDMNETELDFLREWLSSTEECLECYIQGSEKPYYWRPLDKSKNTWEQFFPSYSVASAISKKLV